MAKTKKPLGLRGQLALGFFVALGVVFSSTAVILFFGMLPTIAAYYYDRSKEKLTALTVGAMNLAGCFPFVLELWVGEGHNIDAGLSKLKELRTAVIIYMAAAIGWLLDWAMTGIVATIMVQKGRARLQDIEKRQETLIKRWGKEVTGKVPLNSEGYPIDVESEKD